MIRYLEDFEPGQKFGSGQLSVEATRIKSFAAEFDPQPFHLDEVTARETFFKGLAASGWHTAAMTMRLLVDSELKPAGGIIGAGFDEMRWPRPVRPGDELHVESEVLDVRPSKSRSDQGVIKVRTTTLNQNGEPVQVFVGNLIVLRRPPPQEKHMGKLEGKTALVTGGSSGIGLATAKRFVGEGAYVFITGRREEELSAAVKEVGSNVTGIRGDVSNLADLDRLFDQVKREKGRLDVLFANAGVARYAPLGKITEAVYDTIFDVNVKGVLFTVQKALPLLPDGASIILNASIVGSKGLAANSVYSATKAAVRSFARTWTTDLKERRIRVNAVSPGSTDTPGLSDLLASSPVGEERRKMISAIVPLGRFGTPDEIAKAVVFLASDDSSYITGTELFVDGGFAQV